MANHKDAAKRAIQSVRRRARNRSYRTRMRNQIAELRTTLTGSDPAATQTQFREAVSVIQRLATKGVIHRNQAARRVARLAAAVKKAATAPPPEAKGPAKAKNRPKAKAK
ncbi:MAG: 30S ribosomal protein S20 [Myxococcota bacterium]